eukprot:9474628-Pyramimonas_sp.AAC.2
MTQLGKVAPPNIEQRLFSLDRAVSALRNPEDRPGGQKSRTARSSEDNRDSIFGGATFPKRVVLAGSPASSATNLPLCAESARIKLN